MNFIKSEVLSVEINRLGAELSSIKDLKSRHSTEFMWQGDENIWSGRAPILFPIVGRILNDELYWKGRSFLLKKHGFARKSLFDILETHSNSVHYRLESSKETLSQYPFGFYLDVIFTVKEHTLFQKFIVKNNSNDSMPFTLGGHPGFSLAWEKNDTIDQYFLKFAEVETADTWGLDENSYSVLTGRTKKSLLYNTDTIVLTENIFDRGARIFHNLKSHRITLHRKNDTRSVVIEYSGFPHLGLWAKPGAPYLCIEPWFKCDDQPDAPREFEKKDGILTLEPGEKFTAEISIEIVL